MKFLKKCRSAPTRDRDRGFALVTALWTVLFLSILSAMWIANVRITGKIERNSWATFEMELAASAALNYAIFDLVEKQSGKNKAAGQQIINGVTVAISIEDELGKVDINEGPIELIDAVLSDAGVSQSDRLQIITNISEQRDISTSVIFEATEDLQVLPGITPTVLRKLDPLVTVYSQSQAVDPTVADPRLRKLIRRNSNRSNENNQMEGVQRSSFRAEGRAYTIKATTRHNGIDGFSHSKTIRITGGPKPFLVLDQTH